MKLHSEKGFGIIEVIIAVSILTFILAGLYNLFNSQYRSFEAQRDVSITQRDIRASLSLIERDIRMAGFGVPRGDNPIAALQNGTQGNPADPDSTSINFSPGPFTYLKSITVEPGNIIQVDSVMGFGPGDNINIINNENNNLVGGPDQYIINSVDVVNNKLSMNVDPTLGGIKVGYFVVRDFKTVSYSAVTNAGTGRRELIRDDGTVRSVIIDGVTDFQLSYILDDGSETASPANLSDIRRVRIDLRAETTKEVAKLGTDQIPRELITIVPVKNVRL